jgi:colanic acid biosynthesis glycosyl transferase WcaI
VRSERSGRRPRLLVLNQYYSPGLEATARLLHELCVSLSDEFDVVVVTGMISVGDVRPGQTKNQGVTVIRVNSTSYDRRRLLPRGLNYLTYLFQTLRVALRVGRPDVILCMTDPPMLADIGLIVARRFRVPLIVTSQDVFPEIAVELGRLESPPLVLLLRKLVQIYLQRADRVVAIGETMRDRLEAKGARPDRLRVIPNWVQTDVLAPRPRHSDWSKDNELSDKFVVMHSGNVGHAQNLDSLVRSATFLRDLDDVVIAIIGSGARYEDIVELSDRLDADRIRFLPYQPREMLPYSLSAADIHVVGLARGLSGYVVPSRLYGIMSVGRPVIVAADEESETAQIVARVECGVVIPPGRPEVLADTIRRARDGEFDLEAMGRRAREYAVAEADRSVAVERYRSLLHEVMAE